MDNDDDPQLVRFFDDFSKFATFSPEQILVFLNEQAAFEPQQWVFLKVLVEQFWQNSGVAFEDIPQQKPSVIVEVSSETAQQVMDDLNLHSGRKGTFRGKA